MNRKLHFPCQCCSPFKLLQNEYVLRLLPEGRKDVFDDDIDDDVVASFHRVIDVLEFKDT